MYEAKIQTNTPDLNVPVCPYIFLQTAITPTLITLTTPIITLIITLITTIALSTRIHKPEESQTHHDGEKVTGNKKSPTD
ncbi:hypothetical protein N7536_004339 [Penicillium majusculum]|nr:hypothetical protein N7536_004339 [Penicillium majusculum]